jgi:ribosomal protein L11 methyltransferase
MAFGTGQHASTRLALTLIQHCFWQTQDNRIMQVLDVGTGTGILGMASALFGAEKVLAVDNDPDAVAVCRQNIDANRLSASVEASGRDISKLTGTYDLICANIVHDVLASMGSLFRRLMAPAGRVVLAGILSGEQEKSIEGLYTSLGLTLVEKMHGDEWVALLLAAE